MKQIKLSEKLIIDCLNNANNNPNKIPEILVGKSELKNISFDLLKKELNSKGFDIVLCAEMQDLFSDMPKSQQHSIYYVFKV